MAAILDFGTFFSDTLKKTFHLFEFILALVKKTLYRDIYHHEMFYLMFISKKPVLSKFQI